MGKPQSAWSTLKWTVLFLYVISSLNFCSPIQNRLLRIIDMSAVEPHQITVGFRFCLFVCCTYLNSWCWFLNNIVEVFVIKQSRLVLRVRGLLAVVNGLITTGSRAIAHNCSAHAWEKSRDLEFYTRSGFCYLSYFLLFSDMFVMHTAHRTVNYNKTACSMTRIIIISKRK